jgi:hypothetical protein
MKYLIAHRGNTNGINSEQENHPAYIRRALDKGYDVEIDVWVIEGKIYLGHECPNYEVDLQFLLTPKLWCHAKNFNALTLLIKNSDTIHSFSHNGDEHILTSKGIIWAYVGKEINEETICVLPEQTHDIYTNDDLYKCLGICSDYVEKYAHLK